MNVMVGMERSKLGYFGLYIHFTPTDWPYIRRTLGALLALRDPFTHRPFLSQRGIFTARDIICGCCRPRLRADLHEKRLIIL
jgi:hypothetical protein